MFKNFFYSSLPKTPDNLKVFAVKTLKSGKEKKFYNNTRSTSFPEIARWIVSVMGGNGNSTQVGKCSLKSHFTELGV